MSFREPVLVLSGAPIDTLYQAAKKSTSRRAQTDASHPPFSDFVAGLDFGSLGLGVVGLFVLACLISMGACEQQSKRGARADGRVTPNRSCGRSRSPTLAAASAHLGSNNHRYFNQM
jgi:hypothetical protein